MNRSAKLGACPSEALAKLLVAPLTCSPDLTNGESFSIDQHRVAFRLDERQGHVGGITVQEMYRQVIPEIISYVLQHHQAEPGLDHDTIRSLGKPAKGYNAWNPLCNSPVDLHFGYDEPRTHRDRDIRFAFHIRKEDGNTTVMVYDIPHNLAYPAAEREATANDKSAPAGNLALAGART